MLRSGVDSAGEVINRAVPAALHECDDLRTSGTATTNAGDRLHRIDRLGTVRKAELLHQKTKREGSPKPFRRGATVSNSSMVEKPWSPLRVTSTARMIGSWPTIAVSRPPGFS